MRRNMGHHGNMSNAGGGPLMTGHLQDIDLELELLKRKREMIEQQQQLLAMEQQFKSSRQSYDPMRFDEPQQHGSNRDFTHLYEPGPKYRNQFGKKRQPEFSWQYDGSPKRTIPKKKPNQPQFSQQNQRPLPGSGQGSKYSSKGPTPLMDVKVKQSIGRRIANQKPPPRAPHKEFLEGKVTKPKAPPAPNKMASHSVAKRKTLVAAASGSVSDADVSRMLLPDRVPTQQVSGRLELALGAIMKNIRTLIDSKTEHATLLRSVQLQRVMKQAVRERIRTVMLGKVVGSLLEILAVYREEFPEETDIDIVNIALEAGGVTQEEPEGKIKFIESGDPEKFFKTNMSSILETKLNEMFAALEEMYGNPQEGNTGTAVETIDLRKDPENNVDKKDSIEEHKQFMNRDIKVFEVKRILPRLLKRYIPFIVKLLNVDAMYQTTKAAITMKANRKASTIFVKQLSEEGQGDKITPAPEVPTEERQNMYNLPYYVKIMGRPTLPKRKVMQTFLNQFNPKSIKKHRTIHNLLFVGFSEKSDFDVMVGADGTLIGRCKLSIRICSKGPTAGQNDENGDKNVSKAESQNGSNDGDVSSDLISSDLDCQITDLLSTIRKSEEAENEDQETNNDSAETQPAAEQDKNNTDLLSTIRKSEEVKNELQETDNNSAETQPAPEQDKNNTNEDIIKDEKINENVSAENIDSLENTDEIIENDNVTTGVTEATGDNDTTSQENDVSDKVDLQNEEPANELNEENSEVNKETKTVENSNALDTVMSEVNAVTKTENSDGTDVTKTETSEDSNKAENNVQKPQPETAKTEEEKNDKVGELKSNASGRSTPSRTSTRLANITPSTIRTRRASRLAPN